jgi:hypothetical protein
MESKRHASGVPGRGRPNHSVASDDGAIRSSARSRSAATERRRSDFGAGRGTRVEAGIFELRIMASLRIRDTALVPPENLRIEYAPCGRGSVERGEIAVRRHDCRRGTPGGARHKMHLHHGASLRSRIAAILAAGAGGDSGLVGGGEAGVFFDVGAG